MKGKIFSLIVVVSLTLFVFVSYFNNNNYSQNFRNFESNLEFDNYLRESAKLNQNYNYFAGENFLAGSSDSSKSFDSKSTAGAVTGSEYSSTNIQVKGVDEIDLVKNDGQYIYTAKGNSVIIVRAYPANSMEIVSELKFENYVNGLFLKNDKLIVVESSYGYSLYGGPELDVSVSKIQAPSSSKSEVNIHIYDVSNIEEEIDLIKEFSLEGNFHSARLIGDNVYLISNKYLDYSSPILPYLKGDETVEIASINKISYPNYYQANLVFTSVMSIDIESLAYDWNVFLLGSSNSLYVSESAIYFAGLKDYDYSKVYEDSLSIYVKILPNKYSEEVNSVLKSEKPYYLKYEEISLIVQGYFNSLSIDEKKKFDSDLAEANNEYYLDVSKRYEKTIIHKVEIDGLDIRYSGSGEVAGSLLNQFSMDEFEGYFRVATTTGDLFGNFESSLNHLYILDKDLKVVGKVEDLAKGERIYSSRFLGDKAYMVTFRQVDPLYTIDVSNPKNPKVMGYLKVTGFSNYLHPIKDGLLLGIGREANEEGRAEGLKISLFDVSDFENPKELSKYVLQEDYSYSEAEYEHKAVLFDDKRDLLVIPVSYSRQTGDKWDYWQGAFAFTITDSDISLKGRISHDFKSNNSEQFYGNRYGYVQRSLFIENILYTVSNLMIKANNLVDLTEVKIIDLPQEEIVYYAY